MIWLGLWYVQSGVPVEEADWSQSETTGIHRQYRPVLGTRKMDTPKCMPHNNIFTVNRPVLSYEFGQAGAAGILVDQFSRGVTLTRIVASDPKSFRGKGRAPGRR